MRVSRRNSTRLFNIYHSEHSSYGAFCVFVVSGSESECIGHFKLLFSLLRVHGAGRVQQLVLEVDDLPPFILSLFFPPHPCFLIPLFLSLQVVNTVTSNQECVSNIAESLVLSNLLLLLHSLPSSKTFRQFTSSLLLHFTSFNAAAGLNTWTYMCFFGPLRQTNGAGNLVCTDFEHKDCQRGYGQRSV